MYCTSCGAQVQDGAGFCASCGTRVRIVPARSPRRLSTAITPGASDVSAELRASIEARRELGPDMEDHLVESFLSRLDDRISVRIGEQVARQIPKGSPKSRTGGIHNFPEPALVVVGSLALAIPLMGAGGEFAAIPVMIGVVLINLFYFVFRQQK